MPKRFLCVLMLLFCVAFAVACSGDPSDEDKKPSGDENKHVCTLSHVQAKEPTCTEEGNIQYWECSECSKIYLDSEALTSPDKNSDVILNMLDCVYDGCTCVNCGSGEHTLRYYAPIEPDCDLFGSVEYWECVACDKKFSDENAENTIDKVTLEPAHNGGTEIRDKLSPTEFEFGYTGDTYCLGCGDLLGYGTRIDKLDHRHQLTLFEYVQEGCVENGSLEHWKCLLCGKKYSDENATQEMSVTVIVASHKFLYVPAKASTSCQSMGNLEYWKCTVCDKYFYEDDAATEIFDKTSVFWYAECSYVNCVCKWCNDVKHTLVYNRAVDFECKKDGTIEHWSCTVCLKKYADDEALTLLSNVTVPAAHKGGTEVRNKLTPTEDNKGYTGDTHCKGCGDMLEKGRELDKLDHTHKISHYLSKPADCENNGTIEYWKCSKCGKMYSDEELVTEITSIVEYAYHVLKQVPAKSSTCQEKGNNLYYECTVCSKFFEDENAQTPIPDKNTVKLDLADCAYVNCICKWCGGSDHDLSYVDAKSATCKESGNKAYHFCSKCNKYFEDEQAERVVADPQTLVIATVDCKYQNCHCIWCNITYHEMVHHPAVAPKCNARGNIEYWSCKDCKKLFFDKDGNTEVPDKNFIELDTVDHGYENCVCSWCGNVNHKLIRHAQVQPTCQSEGSEVYWVCENCQKWYADTYARTEIVNKTPQTLPKVDCNFVNCKCQWCGKENHKLTYYTGVQPTCQNKGSLEHWACTNGCGGYYSDAAGKVLIADKSTIEIPVVEHSYQEWVCIWCSDVKEHYELEFKVVEDLYLVVTGLGSYHGNNLVINSTYDGLPVKRIASGALEGYNDISTVVIADGVEIIEERAFADCTQLVSITLPSTLTKIEEEAFIECNKLIEVINRSKITLKAGRDTNGMVAKNALYIHSGASKIKQIDDFLFTSYSGKAYLLSYVGNDYSVVLPKSYNGASYSVFDYAFEGRTDILSITIQPRVLQIGKNAFKGCMRLVEVINKGDLEISVGYTTCGAVAENAIDVHSLGSKIVNENGYLFYTDNAGFCYLIGYCGSEEELVLPKSYNDRRYEIWKQAFAGNHTIKSVTVQGATYIGDMAFYNCASLESVVIDSLLAIGNSVFQGCAKLKTVEYKIQPEYIGSYVYFMCPNFNED